MRAKCAVAWIVSLWPGFSLAISPDAQLVEAVKNRDKVVVGALLKQGESSLVDAPLVEDPAEGIRDVWVLWGHRFSRLREL